MAEKENEVIDLDSYPSSSDVNSTPLRPVYCLRNRGQIMDAEKKEDLFVLEFDPYDEPETSGFPLQEDCDTDLRIVGERGQVACRDYPHSRHTCVRFIFDKTPHDSYCELCYCYVCDVSAPCTMWFGSYGHCHAFNNREWDQIREAWRASTTTEQADNQAYQDPFDVYRFVDETQSQFNELRLNEPQAHETEGTSDGPAHDDDNVGPRGRQHNRRRRCRRPEWHSQYTN